MVVCTSRYIGVVYVDVMLSELVVMNFSVLCMCEVAIIGKGEYFTVCLRCKCKLEIFFSQLYVAISEKNYFTNHEHGYVHITKHRYFIRRCCLFCETTMVMCTSQNISMLYVDVVYYARP